MKRALAGALLALAFCAGSARGDTFAVIASSDPSTTSGGLATSGFSATATALPSAQVPNNPGSLLLPPNWTQQAGQEAPISSSQLRALWQSAGSAYSIPWAVLAAINKVESNYGRNMGPSSAGALGWMQFMPSTWLRWGADYDGDGVADPWNAKDGIFSAARYLAAAGGASDISRAIFSYNHAQWYVNEVLSIAHLLSTDGSLSFSLDALQVNLDKAAQKVASLSQQIAALRTRAHTIRVRAQRMFAAAENAQLISERAAMRMRAADVEARAVPLEAQIPDLASALETAQTALAKARANSQAPSFDSGTSVYLSSPQFQSGYVFPVGGGPSRVSVGHTHHDYPAADIAAPTGSPVYALANGVVARAWRTIDPLCGIGMDYRTDDGRTWAYCHLSYIEPSVVTGTRLSAGTLVGLVGETGHATGPHLHLGLIPSSQGYPQNDAWFQSFAGIAFRWQDAPTPSIAVDSTASSSPIVFTIVSDATAGDTTAAGSWSVASQTVTPITRSTTGAGAVGISPFATPPSGTVAMESSGSVTTATPKQVSTSPFSK